MGEPSASSSGSWADQPLGELLASMASVEPGPRGGSVAALATAMAAATIEMSARVSRGWSGSSDAVTRAEDLRERLCRLAQEDAEAYAEVLAARRRKADDREIGRALARAAELPLAIAEAAASVAQLGAEVAREGKADVRGDAVAGALLAEAGARAAGNLVAINLSIARDDPRIRLARELVDEATAAAQRAWRAARELP